MAKIDWRAFVALLPTLTEDEVKHMLDDELDKHRRPAYARRLHQRYASLRTQRERKDIMESIAR